MVVVNTTLKVSHAANKVVSTAFNTDVVTEGSAFVQDGAVSTPQLNVVFDTTKVLDQYGVVLSENPTIIISNLTKVESSSFVASNSGTTTATIAGATAGDKFTATYTYASGVTATVNFTVTGTDITAPTVTTKMTAASTITSAGTHTLVFSEALNTTSADAVKTAVLAAFTANGTATKAAAWSGDGKTLTVTLAGTVGVSPNDVVLASIANMAVTDLAGNTSAALDIQLP